MLNIVSQMFLPQDGNAFLHGVKLGCWGLNLNGDLS